MSSCWEKYGRLGLVVSGTMLTSPAEAAEFGQELGHMCDNELACIESLYEEKKYDPVDFAALKLLIGGSNSVSYNDNILRSSNNEKSDFINRFSPRVALESNLDRHYLGAEVEAENASYFSNSENNYTDFSAIAAGRYDVDEGSASAVYARAGYVLDHVGIGSFVEDPGATNAEPVPYHTILGHVAFDYLPQNSALHVNVGVGADDINYENVATGSGGVNIQDDRDRTEYKATALIGYRMHSESELYIKTVQESWDHDRQIDSSALSTRDSQQHRYLVGYRDNGHQVAGLSYDVAVGYLEQNYDAARLPDVSGLDVYADAQWKLDPVNKLSFQIRREVRDAYSDQRSAYLRSRARVNYEHSLDELTRLGIGATYTNNDFKSLSSAPIDREDDTYNAHLWGAYEFYEDVEAKLYYTYTDRDSNDPTANYNANVIGIALSYKN